MADNSVQDGILFDKIGGWLVLPAFVHPIFGVIANARGSIELFNLLSDKLPQATQFFIFAFAMISVGFTVAWIVSGYLAATLSPEFPRFYIWLSILGIISPLLVLWIGNQYFATQPEPDDIKDCVKNIVIAAVWVPYMLLSRRVKATFLGIPMSRKAIYQNVNSPLKQVVEERATRRDFHSGIPPKDEPNMVQRLGLVLYWTGTGIAVLLAGAGAFAALNASRDASFISGALLVCAVVSWLVGRALKFVLVGR